MLGMDQIKGTFHVHPSGQKAKPMDLTDNSNSVNGPVKGFRQSPSVGAEGDLGRTKTRAGYGISGNNYVLAAREEKVYVYTQDGVIATFPLTKLREIGNK